MFCHDSLTGNSNIVKQRMGTAWQQIVGVIFPVSGVRNDGQHCVYQGSLDRSKNIYRSGTKNIESPEHQCLGEVATPGRFSLHVVYYHENAIHECRLRSVHAWSWAGSLSRWDGLFQVAWAYRTHSVPRGLGIFFRQPASSHGRRQGHRDGSAGVSRVSHGDSVYHQQVVRSRWSSRLGLDPIVA